MINKSPQRQRHDGENQAHAAAERGATPPAEGWVWAEQKILNASADAVLDGKTSSESTKRATRKEIELDHEDSEQTDDSIEDEGDETEAVHKPF